MNGAADTVWIVPFAIQGLAMAVDEFYFHRKRGLPLWERLGHPLDNLAFIACLSIPLFFPMAAQSFSVYVLLAVFSSILITKDEFVHAERCSKGEHWLHALLFLIHPLVLIDLAVLWASKSSHPLVSSVEQWSEIVLPTPEFVHRFLILLLGADLLFLTYQIVFWNFSMKRN